MLVADQPNEVTVQAVLKVAEQLVERATVSGLGEQDQGD
jgi:hypothetical protein